MATKDVSQDDLLALFKDGIYEDIYTLMWSKDELNFSPSINIPDTIIYKYGQPQSWYFTAINGRVKKKNKHNLISAKIEEVFNKHVLGYDVLAYFISVPVDSENGQGITIEYLDREALNNFLYKRKKEVNGVLQRFIEPKTTRNEVIRAIWSPRLCLLERAENIHQLHDHRYGLYERCVIYEGPEYYFSSAPLRGPVLSGKIQKQCESIVNHVSEVTFGQKQISRIVLNFKVDSRDKVWLLYCTSSRCIDMLKHNNSSDEDKLKRELLNIDSVVALSKTVHLNPNKSYQKIVPKNRIRCLSCAKESLEDKRYPITFKSIIKHFDHVLHLLTTTSTGKKKESIPWPPDAEMVEAAGGVNFGCLYMTEQGDILGQRELDHLTKIKNVKDLIIPPILQSLHPKLSIKSYLQCKNDPLFLHKVVHVCEPCFLVFAEFTTMLLRMGGDLTKLLTADPEPKNTATMINGDWSSVGSNTREAAAMKKPKLGTNPRNENHVRAKKHAIGIRGSDTRSQPDMPSTIRNTNDYEKNDNSTILTNEPSFLTTDPRLFDEKEHIRSMIEERERHFFKEVALNPQLRDQHPLMHLISTQEKLKLVEQQSGVLKTKATNEKQSVFGTKYGKQKGDKYDKYAVYSKELPYTLGGEVILPSKLRERKREAMRQIKREKMLRKKSFEMPKTEETSIILDGNLDIPVTVVKAEDDDNTQNASRASTATSAIDKESVGGSVKHREFLRNALLEVESELSVT